MNNKILLTSGCSFSECVSGTITWPRILASRLSSRGYDHHSSAMGSQGNGLISRSIIYNVSESLKTYKPDDILVGVMWSGPGRHDYFVNNPSNLSFADVKIPPNHDARGMPNYDGWLENPTGFIPGSTKNWVILNYGWRIKESKLYYENFFDPVGCMIQTVENILRVQWYLKQVKVKYFFTCYTDYVLHKRIFDDLEDVKDHEQIKHLYDMIDFDNFLPVKSITSWLDDNKIGPTLGLGGVHPNRNQHEAFVDQVILPYLHRSTIG